MRIFIWEKLARTYLWLAENHWPYWMQAAVGWPAVCYYNRVIK